MYHKPNPAPLATRKHPNSDMPFNSNIAHTQLQYAGFAAVKQPQDYGHETPNKRIQKQTRQ